MEKPKKRITKPASKDPVKEAIGHPDGPSLQEMLDGEEEKNTRDERHKLKKPGKPDIPVI